MKKFNVKVLSMAVAAAVVSGAASAEEVNFAQAIEGGKSNHGKAAFFAVYGEGTKFDTNTGKLTFKKDADALLLKTMELEQAVNGFAAGSNFVATNEDGSKTVREATNADITADSMKGVGLAGGIAAVNTRVDNLAKDIDEALDEQDQTVEQLKAAITSNNEHIAKVAGDVAEMGKEVSAKFDEVDEEITKASTELSESIEKVAGDVTAVNKRVDTLEQDTAAAKASAKAAEDKVTELSANVDSKVKEAKDAAKAAEDKAIELSANVDGKVKEAKDAADKAVDAASKIDAVADKADKASKGVAGLTEALEKVSEQALLASAENAQALNGFAEGDEIVVTDADGIKSVKKATKEDVEQDEFGGLGLKEVAEKHDQSLADLTAETERAKKAAEQAAFAAIENAQELNGFKEKDEIIVTDDNGVKSVKTATKEDVEKDEFDGLGLKEVVAQHDASLYDLTETVNDNSEALVKTAEVVNAISADVNANKAALEEQKEANEGFNNAIASLDKDIGDLASAGKAAMEALEVNRQDIDANKKYIGDLALAGKAAADALEANRQDIDANKAAIAENTAKLEEQKEANEGFNNAIASLDKDIGDLASAGKAAMEALEVNRQDIDVNKAAIAENTAKLEEQKEANEGFNNAIASLDKDIGDLASAGKAAMEALEVNRQDIDANKTAIETKADKADFEELAKYTADMGKKVNDIGDEVTALSDATSAAITRHDKDIVDLAKGLQLAAEAVEDNRKEIDANKAAIAENTASLKEQEEANEGFNNAIASLDEDIAANKAAIETKADKTDVEAAQKSAENAESHAEAAQASAVTANNVASAAQTAAAQAQDAVKANAAQVATNKADIATLQTASSQHAAGIAKNSARIDSLDKNVANLRKETRQGLAAQAALSGLFQPYSVGKFNVTAALGGFKSDTAVAVGAGYRFNENFAAKAGLAVGTSSGGSASYNVGVNYEW